MSGILHRGLGLLLAVALVIAGLPMAHTMPDQAPVHHHDMAATGDMPAMSATDHAHHHAGTVMDVATRQDNVHQDTAADPCKCLNCSMCVASFVAPLMWLPTPERLVLAVTYRVASSGIPGIAARVDPGIPILAV